MSEGGPGQTQDVVLDRDGHECRYCGRGEDSARLELHHVTYRREGGLDTPENLITLCEEHHGLAHGLGNSGDDPIAVLQRERIPKDWPGIRGLNSPANAMVFDTLLEGRDFDGPWGYTTIRSAAKETALNAHYVERALKDLLAAGWVERPYRGLYRFVADPRTDNTG